MKFENQIDYLFSYKFGGQPFFWGCARVIGTLLCKQMPTNITENVRLERETEV